MKVNILYYTIHGSYGVDKGIHKQFPNLQTDLSVNMDGFREYVMDWKKWWDSVVVFFFTCLGAVDLQLYTILISVPILAELMSP